MLTLDKVSFSYGRKPVLDRVSASFPETGILCFTAPSGAGKTTLLRLLAGLEKPDSGTIRRSDGQRVAVMFQENCLFPWLTAAQNVALALPKSCENQAVSWLQQVELAESAFLYPDQLSGGMQRRVALARALAFEGDVLLLDEPFTGLDGALRERMADLVRKGAAERLTVVVTHSPEEAALLHVHLTALVAPLSGPLF